jgi:putative membrane protein
MTPAQVGAVGLTALVALLHLYFLVLEMFLWESPVGRRAFGLTAEMARATKTLAANQGLYNGFLAAGLIWALWRGTDGLDIRYFFLGCVVVAGIFGAVTANPRILWIQALPAALAIVVTWLARG